MPQKEARDEAIRRAKEGLEVDLGSGGESVAQRCSRLGLPEPADGFIEFPLFGSPARLELSTLALTEASGGERSQTDRILFYHYFSAKGAVAAGGELISFRDLTGGAFYWEPFRSRTCLPLAGRYGDDPTGLRRALSRYDWSELELGDFAARVHGMGNLFLTIVAYAAEEGLGAEIIVLFDPVIKRVYRAEDAAAFASRICLAML
ncbi:MAG: DUF3786 domain-containing protein [Rectinemataceae bacterium]